MANLWVFEFGYFLFLSVVNGVIEYGIDTVLHIFSDISFFYLFQFVEHFPLHLPLFKLV